MKNPHLYISPFGAPEKKHALDVSFDGVSKYESKIFPARRAKRNEVPPMYRKSILKSVLKGILFAFFALIVLNCVLFFVTVL